MGVALWRSNRGAPRTDAPLLRLSIAPGAEAASPEMPAISPDGRHVAFSAVSPDGIQRLWIWSTESARSQAVGATDGAVLPFWSPDSRQVAFFAGGKLKKVDVNGGAPQVLADAPAGAGGSWNQNGVIVFAPAGAGRLHRVLGRRRELDPAHDDRARLAGHDRTGVRGSCRTESTSSFCAQEPGQIASSVHVASLRSPDRAARLLTADSEAAYSSGFLIYARGPRLLAHAFDVERLQTTGESVPHRGESSVLADRGVYSAFSVSSSGIVVLLDRRCRQEAVCLVRQDRARPAEESDRRDCTATSISSPDGRRLVVARYDPDRGLNNLWLMDVERGTLSRFSIESRSHTDPVWSPDGRRVAFSVREKLFFDLHQQGTDANARDEVLLTSEHAKSRGGLVGRREVHSSMSCGKEGLDLWMLPTFGLAGAEAVPR